MGGFRLLSGLATVEATDLGELLEPLREAQEDFLVGTMCAEGDSDAGVPGRRILEIEGVPEGRKEGGCEEERESFGGVGKPFQS